MAHAIRSNDSLVLARTAAWHGLGKILPEAVTPAEALRIGGLDWMVEESTSLTACFVNSDGTAERNIIESHKTLRRSDDHSILATVGSEYCVLQNTRLAEIAASLGAEGAVKVETCGSLFGGRKVFILLKGETLDIGRKGDIVEQYALLANSNDGTMATTMFPTSTRVVCNNTLTAAFAAAGAGVYRWRHTSGLTLRIEDIKAALATYGIAAKAEAEAMEALAAKSLTRDEIQSLWTDVLVALDGPIAKNPKDESQARRRQRAVDALADMTRVFDTEAQQFGASAWVAANAATNYIQYHRGTLTGEARANSDLFGAYAEAKRLVMRQALALV